jgi:hypothetical protein
VSLDDVPQDERAQRPGLILARQAVGECFKARAELRRHYGPELDLASQLPAIDAATHRIITALDDQILALSEEEREVAVPAILTQLLKTLIEIAPAGAETWWEEWRFLTE